MRLASAQPDLRVILSLALLAEFIAPLVVFSVGALAPLLRDSLHLSREQIGSLTACFFAGVALAGIPMGWVADRYGLRSFLIAVQAVNGLGLIAISGLHTYAELLPLMFLAGLARGSVMILTTKALYEWFPRERRATAIGAKFFAMAIAGVVAGAAVPILALWAGWQQAFVMLGGLSLASALGYLLLYRDRPRAAPGVEFRAADVGRRSLWRDRNFLCLATVGFLFGGVQFTFSTYLSLFLHESWGLSLVLAARLLALSQLAALSRLPYGWVSDRWLKGERKPLLRGLGVLAMGSLLALLLMPQGTPFLALSAVIFLFGMSGFSWSGLHQTMAAELAGRESAGVGSGITMTFLQIGSTVTPPLFGYTADITGSYTGSWGMLVLWLLLGIGLLSWVQTASPLAEERAEPRLLSGTR
jgi:MFS transporter, ACS family, hexuronate transporter